jgi:alanyl-tRNA synthetase
VNSEDLRTAFFKFFEEKGHKIIPSSSLVPKGDPTLLLTNAGMVQIKPYFLGEAEPPSPRLASCQKCFRTSDIEEVGDATHLTFFEMLGNFSVGDYFKKEAIAWGWEFVTERMMLPPEKLWATIYLDDDEAFQYWRDIGLPESRIARFGDDSNLGPRQFGPAALLEIHSISASSMAAGPTAGLTRVRALHGAVNLSSPDNQTKGNALCCPPQHRYGHGVERLLTIMTGKASIYETDLFAPQLAISGG